MSVRKKSAAANRITVHTAWKKAQSAWKRAEKSLSEMVTADQALFHSLGDAGSVAVKKVKSELKVRGRQFDRSRDSAMKEFHRLTHRIEALRHKPVRKARSARVG